MLGIFICSFTNSCHHEFGAWPASLQPPNGICPCLGLGYSTSQHARIEVRSGINKPRATLDTCEGLVFEVFFNSIGRSGSESELKLGCA